MRVSRGLSLAEVAVTLVLTSLAWIGVIGLLQVSVRSTRRSVLDDEVRWAVQAVADSADLAGAAVGRSDFGWGWIEFRPQSGGTRYEAWTIEQGRIAVLWTAGGSP
ncbi:MAG: hypothetical protein KJP18_01555 [Gemmatimonadetes bacterium]|nr:hypothetical protein [Gemmatimonadota bacterium]NNF37640.1 hypothetical protein [Gemmatimonadota bacterium]